MIVEDKKQENLEFLYYIDSQRKYENGKAVSKTVLKKSPIIKETKYSYYVPKLWTLKTKEDYFKRFGKENCSECNLVKKDTMLAKVSNYGCTYERYYQHPFLAKESFFVERNANKIGRALSQSKNAFLLRQIAHNLEIENLEELEYEDA